MKATATPATELRVLEGKRGDVFVRFGDGEDYRVELLNGEDARELRAKLDEVIDDE